MIQQNKLSLMPDAVGEFVDPWLSNIAFGPSVVRQYWTTSGQQICIVPAASGIICILLHHA